MSVYVYKDDEKELICPTQLDNHLTAGWSVEDPSKKKTPAKKAVSAFKEKFVVSDE